MQVNRAFTVKPNAKTFAENLISKARIVSRMLGGKPKSIKTHMEYLVELPSGQRVYMTRKEVEHVQ